MKKRVPGWMYEPVLIERIRRLVGSGMGKRDATYTFRLPGTLKSMVDSLPDEVKRELHDTFIALMVIAVDREAMPDRVKLYLE